MPRRTKGEGTLYQAKDKSWVYQYRVDGQRKTKRFQRKADAKAFMDAMALAAAAPTGATNQMGAPVQRQSAAVSEILTLGEWMDRWLENYARPPSSTPPIAVMSSMFALTSSRRSAGYI